MTRRASMKIPTLWHFTCADHGYAALGNGGFLRPNNHPFMPDMPPLVWLTSDPNPTADDVGLTSRITRCDRLAYRYRVTIPTAVTPWSKARLRCPTDVAEDLERYGRPETWWVSSTPQPVRLDDPLPEAV